MDLDVAGSNPVGHPGRIAHKTKPFSLPPGVPACRLDTPDFAGTPANEVSRSGTSPRSPAETPQHKGRAVTLGAWDPEANAPSAEAKEEFCKLTARLLAGK